MRLFNLHIITDERMRALMDQTRINENLRCVGLLDNLYADVSNAFDKNSGTRLKQTVNEQVKLITQKALSTAAQLIKESLNGQ